MAPTADAPPIAAAPVASTGTSARRQAVLRGLAVAFGVAVFAWSMRDLDARSLATALAALGPLALLILVPQAAGMSVHAAAWRELLVAQGARVPLGPLVRTFVGAEAARMALPAGPAVGESLAAWALKARFDVPWSSGLASLAGKKAWVMTTNGLCLAALFVVAREPMARLSASLPAGDLLPWVGAGSALALGAGGVGTLLLLSSRRAGRTARALAARTPFARLRSWAAEGGGEHRAALSISVGAHARAALLLLAQWLTETFETWLVLRLLGVELSFAQALTIELAGNLVRSLAFFVPAGLGVQDASYVGLLGALGVGGAAAAAAPFVLLKRAKDVFYVGLGLALLALSRRSERLAPAGTGLVPEPALSTSLEETP